MFSSRFLRVGMLFGFMMLALCATRSARADSFTLYAVADGYGDISNVGLTSGGTLVVSTDQSASFGPIFDTFTPGSAIIQSTVKPTLTYDNGTSCTPTDTSAFVSVSQAICNNGNEVFVGYTDANGFGLYDGTDPLTDLIVLDRFGFEDFQLNSAGDVAFVAVELGGDANPDVSELAINSGPSAAVTPEPSSVILLGTGLLAMLALCWRKRSTLPTESCAA
jgi:hypothetical protein